MISTKRHQLQFIAVAFLSSCARLKIGEAGPMVVSSSSSSQSPTMWVLLNAFLTLRMSTGHPVLVIPYQLDSYFENPLLTIFQLFCVQRIRCPLPSPGLAIEEFVQLVGNNGKEEEDRGLDEVVRESFWLSCLHVGTKVA